MAITEYVPDNIFPVTNTVQKKTEEKRIRGIYRIKYQFATFGFGGRKANFEETA
jgi:hypothetical protein